MQTAEMEAPAAAQDAPIVLPAIPPLPQASSLVKVADSVHAAAMSITIDSPEMYEIAVTELQELQTKLDTMTEQRFTITRPMDAAKKAVMELFRGPTERCEMAIAHLKSAMLAFTREQKRIADQKQREADELARQERARLEAEARAKAQEVERQERIAEEARRQAAEQQRLAEAAQAAGDAKAVEAAQAKMFEAQEVAAKADEGKEVAQQEAQTAALTATVLAPTRVAAAVPKAKGISTSAPWTAEVVDLVELVKYVAANPQFINFLTANNGPLVAQAKSLQANCKIPGVRVYQEERLTSRRK